MDRTIEKVLPIFARHETFHPRFGWLKKGFDSVKNDGEVFKRKDSVVKLGVGKNMVRAIEYWCRSFKLIEEKRGAGRKKVYVPTEFGERLLSDNGLDPYLEEPGTLWLLHWSLLQKPCYAASWYFMFNEFKKLEFTAAEIVDHLENFRVTHFPRSRTAESSLKKDAACILRMYSENRKHKGPIEDSIDSPFMILNLIKQSEETDVYYFNIKKKRNLPAQILTAACLDYAKSCEANTRTITINRLLFHKGSPGQIFKVSQGELIQALDKIAGKSRHIHLAETSGIIQLSFTKEPESIIKELLSDYYQV